MEDQSTGIAEVAGVAVVILFVSSIGVLDCRTSTNAILSEERNVVGLLDLDTSNLKQAFTRVQITLGVTNIPIQDISVHARN